ncbi:hypothetical protein J2T56_000892 [Natronobacillus azotifigens]
MKLHFNALQALRQIVKNHPYLQNLLHSGCVETPVTDGLFSSLEVAVFHFRFLLFFSEQYQEENIFYERKKPADSLENIKLKFFFFFDSFFGVFHLKNPKF